MGGGGAAHDPFDIFETFFGGAFGGKTVAVMFTLEVNHLYILWRVQQRFIMTMIYFAYLLTRC